MRIPDEAGLYHVRQQVSERKAFDGDPWGGSGAIFKAWATSFDTEQSAGNPENVDGPDYWFKAEVEDVDFDIHFRLGRSSEGALVVTGLLLGNPGGTQAITTSNLHRLPIGAIYEAIGALDDVTTALSEKARPFQGEIPARGGQRSSQLEFVVAAQHYKQCLFERPNDTIKCVSEKLAVSSATASRRVSRARDMGLLSADVSDLDRMAEIIKKLDEIISLKPGTAKERAERAKPGQLWTKEDTKEEVNLKVELFQIEERIGVPDKSRRGIPF